jgi:hypothetical protein
MRATEGNASRRKLMRGKTHCHARIWPTVILVPALLCAQVSAAATTADTATQEIEEVEVVGKRLYQMRQEIIEAEERFFALYNELNKNDDFDVHCRRYVPTGTHLAQRVCRVEFVVKAQAEEARAFLTGDYAPPTDLVALERADEYRKHALALINGNPQLRRLVREREALEKKYNATRKARFKGRWISF